jgi:4-amino-4-deoxy-L-arabinose transferase-like glycosyltransferase
MAVASAIVLFSFSLQLYRLDTQSFAFDEGWTSYAIHHGWDTIWGVLAPDNHPPLYYVLVKAFADIAGYGDFCVRFVSVFWETVLIAAIYALGRRLHSTVAGLAAELCASLWPLFVYYAQEARMYSQLMALAVLASYSLVRLAHKPDDRRWLVSYALTACAALYTHYFAIALIGTHSVLALVWLLVQRERRWFGRWLLGQCAIALLYAPWFPIAVHQVSIGQGTWWRMPLPTSVILRDLWRFFTLGPRRPTKVPILGTTLGGVAMSTLTGVLLGWRKRWAAWAFALTLLLLPVTMIVWAGSTWPIYTDRYALVAAPGLPLIVGLGIAACWHALPGRRAWWGRVAAVVLFFTAATGPLPHLRAYYTDPAYWREDFRRAAQYVMDTSGLGDAVILIGCYQPIMQYYRGRATIVRFPQQGDSVQGEAEVIDALNEAIGPESQVRLVMHSWPTVDPQGLVEGMLRAQCRLQGEHWQRETGQRPIKVLNLEACTPFAPEPRQSIDAILGDQVALTAYRLIHFEPHKQAHAFLWWRAIRRPDQNYSAFVHLVGADGEIITQYDHVPLSDFYPMQAWSTGVDLRDDYPLNLPADVDLEGAWLAVGLYDRVSGQRLPTRVDGVDTGDLIRIPLE